MELMSSKKSSLNSSTSAVPVIVTIDGPAASGKTSVSRELARRLGWSWVSTGAFYRGLAYLAHIKNANLESEPDIVALVKSGDLHIKLTDEQTRVVVSGRDATDDISKESIGSIASKISSYPKVRQALLQAQRDCALGVQGLVAEGRDCGTVVFPHAVVKFFLTAKAEDRAARRAKDEGRDTEALVKEQKVRDIQDASRKTAPMQASEDSHTIDTTTLSFDEVVSRVEKLVRERVKRTASLDKA